MERDAIFKELNELNQDKIIFNNLTINRLHSLSTLNLNTFYNYHNIKYNDAIRRIDQMDDAIQSYRVGRTHILDFLEYCNNLKLSIDNLNQSTIDDYFLEKSNNLKRDTLKHYRSDIKNFLVYYGVEYDDSEVKKLANGIDSQESPHKALSCEEIENIKEYYKDMPLKLFIFQALYTLKAQKNELPLFRYNKYDPFNREIKIKKRIIKIKDNIVHELFEKLKDHKQFNGLKDYTEYISSMENELYENEIIKNRFRPKDITKTLSEGTYHKCPECGELFESIADNWVIKQYNDNSKMWIVCKEHCGRINEN